jgi:hypothetical protein
MQCMQGVSEISVFDGTPTLQEIIGLWFSLRTAHPQKLGPTAATTAATKNLVLD